MDDTCPNCGVDIDDNNDAGDFCSDCEDGFGYFETDPAEGIS